MLRPLLAGAEDPLPPAMVAALSTAPRPWPKITVVTPSYNQGGYIEETIRSVLDQGYPELEYIVVDGASTDDTRAVLQRYDGRLAHWISEPDRGQSEAINKGFARASGDILGWLNSDDKLAPGALFAIAQAFRRTGADVVAGAVDIARDGERLYRHRTGLTAGPLPLHRLLDLEGEWLEGRFFFQPEVYVARRALEAVGGRVETGLFYSMDYDLWVRLAEAGCTIAPIDWTVAQFRVHAEQKTSSVAAYLPELTAHNRVLRRRNSLGEAALAPPAPAVRRPARVALVNDMGFDYGAGRAHRRIAAVLAASGMEVGVLALLSPSGAASRLEDLVEVLADFAPDAIVLGNLHGAYPEGADLAALAAIAPLMLVTHDFFWFTGRCPYPRGCREHFGLCSPDCPTADEYPAIGRAAIPQAHAAKAALWRSPRVFFAANSDYVMAELERFLAVQAPDARARLQRVRLGVPEAAYRPQDRGAARARFGLGEADFVVLVASTSLGDPRKRFDHVLAACRASGIERLVILAMGRVDPAEAVAEVVYTGYLTDDAEIAACFNAADLFVGASQDETFGQTFVEAALCGCPSLAYGVGALAEVVIEGETGWLAPDGDVEALTAALSRMASRADAGELRARAALHARSHFAAASMLQSWQEALRQVIADPAVRIPAGVQYDGGNARPVTTIDAQRWRAQGGYDPAEGPYPQFAIPRRLWWQVAQTGVIDLRVQAAGAYEIVVECETAAADQALQVEVGSTRFADVELQPSDWRLIKVLRLRAMLPAGWTTLRITAARKVRTPERDLWLAVFDVTAKPTAKPCGAGELSRRLDLAGSPFELDREPIAAAECVAVG